MYTTSIITLASGITIPANHCIFCWPGYMINQDKVCIKTYLERCFTEDMYNKYTYFKTDMRLSINRASKGYGCSNC